MHPSTGVHGAMVQAVMLLTLLQELLDHLPTSSPSRGVLAWGPPRALPARMSTLSGTLHQSSFFFGRMGTCTLIHLCGMLQYAVTFA